MSEAMDLRSFSKTFIACKQQISGFNGYPVDLTVIQMSIYFFKFNVIRIYSMALCSTSTVEIGMYCMERSSQFVHLARHVRRFSPLLYQRPEPFQGWIRMEEGKGGWGGGVR